MKTQSLSTLNLAVKNLERRITRTLWLSGLVALLAFVLLGSSLLAASLIRGTNSLSARLGADAILVPEGYEAEVTGALLRGEPSVFYFDETVAERLMKIEGIKQSSPQLFISSFDSPHCSVFIQMIGYDPETDFVIGPWLAKTKTGPLGMREIIIGSDINANVGDELQFFATTYNVAGKLERTGMGFDSSVFMNMETAHNAIREYNYFIGKEVPENAVSSVVVNVGPDLSVNDFKRMVESEFRGDGVAVVMTQAILSNVSGGLKAMLVIIGILIVTLWLFAVGVLAILFTVTLNERRQEFGVYRVLGATRRKLAEILLCESAIVSLVGSAVGAVILCLIYFSFSPLIGISVDMPYLQPSASTAILLIGGGLLLSFLTGPLAAWRTAMHIGRIATQAILREGE